MIGAVKLAALIVTFLLSTLAAAEAHENEHEPPRHTAGLVKLPQLFGAGPCTEHQPTPVPLYSAPRLSARVGEIRVTKRSIALPEGGCSTPEISAILEGQVSHLLPTLEFVYEEPAAIAISRSGPWCEICLRSGSAWIRDGCAAGFLSPADLFTDRALYLRGDALENMRLSPGGKKLEVPASWRTSQQVSAKLMRVRISDGKPWMQLSAPVTAQLPRPHSITSCARRRSDRGTWSPSAFAARMLMTRSSRVGCSMGRFSGLAPLRIRST